MDTRTDKRLSDIREETSVDLSDAEAARDPELEKAIKQVFEATKHGWALFKILELVHARCIYIYKGG